MDFIFDDKINGNEATAALADWAEQIGFRISRYPEGDRFTLRGRFNYGVWVAGDAGLRRIVCIATFPGSPNHRDSDGKLVFANRINLDYNVCKASFGANGDLHLEFVLYVESTVTPSLWSTFFSRMDDGVSWLYSRHKDELEEMLA